MTGIMWLFFLLTSLAAAETLPNTAPLTPPVDPARKMVEGISAYLRRATAASVTQRRPDREELRRIIGATGPRVEFADLELIATTSSPALVAETAGVQVFRVRWPALEGVTAEGLYFKPAHSPAARVVVLPDADQAPEQSPIG